MGVLYSVTPPTKEVADWLSDAGIDTPEDASARGPLLTEIREVLDSLDGYTVEYNDNGVGHLWQAMITSKDTPEFGPWTLLNITSLGDSKEAQAIWFEKGHPELIVEILSRLSSYCGTTIVIPDTGCPPLVIFPGDDPGQLCAQWEHLAPGNGTK